MLKMSDRFFPFITDGQVTKASDPDPIALVVDEFTQYEWVARENRWSTIFDGDPEPPSNLPRGKFDGQIIDVEKK